MPKNTKESQDFGKSAIQYIDNLILKFNSLNRTVRLSTLSIFVGIIGGLGAVLFRFMIIWSNYLFVILVEKVLHHNVVSIILAPTLGGLVVGAMIYYIAAEAKGHGVPEIIFSVNKEAGKMRYRVPFIKILASAITIGSGGSAGREGPIAQIGGGFGSLLGQFFKLTIEERKTLVIAGVSAGISATFNAPLGGILFGIEIIRRDQKYFSAIPLVVSSVVGTTIGELFLGQNPAFIFPVSLKINNFESIPFYIIVGGLMGVLGILWVLGFYFIEDLFEKIPTSAILVAGLGGLIVGIIEVFTPEVNGISYTPIDNAFNLQFSISVLLQFIIAKFLATSASIGSGGSGGVFAPTLFIGVMGGTAFGLILHEIGYSNEIVELYALLGMAALFAASSRAPLTAIIMTSEMVNDFHLLLPLMFAVSTAWIISMVFLKNDIYVLKLLRRGVVFDTSYDVLEKELVSNVMISDPITVHSKDRIEHVVSLMKKSGHTGYPVVDEHENLVGIITEHDVNRALDSVNIKKWSVGEAKCSNLIVCHPTNNLSTVLMLMATKNVNRIPVVSKTNKNQLIGWITRSDVMKEYLRLKSEDRANLIEEKMWDTLLTNKSQ